MSRGILTLSHIPFLSQMILKPKRLSAYRIPEKLKPEVDCQIQEMLRNDIIRPSQSPRASPLVCVLKGKEGCNGVRLAVDYRYVNRFARSDHIRYLTFRVYSSV